MKISELNINRKITFNNEEIDNNSVTDKEINFKSLNIELLQSLHDNILSKITDETTDNEILFLTLPYLTDLEIDITFEEFSKMVQLPSKELCQLLEAVIDEITLIIDTSNSINQLSKKSTILNKKINKLISNNK